MLNKEEPDVEHLKWTKRKTICR